MLSIKGHPREHHSRIVSASLRANIERRSRSAFRLPVVFPGIELCRCASPAHHRRRAPILISNLDLLRCNAGAPHPRPVGCPGYWINAQPARRHPRIPGVVYDEIRFAIWSDHDGIVTRSKCAAWGGAQNPWSGGYPRISVGAQRRIGHGVVHAVIVRFPAAAAIKAVILSVMLANAWTFERVPV